MYALARNAWKYIDRDKRTDTTQYLEYSYLAPDTINETMDTLRLLELFTGKAALQRDPPQKTFTEAACIKRGRSLLLADAASIDALEITAEGFENTKRKTVLLKVRQ
jgi:hypothetical protein